MAQLLSAPYSYFADSNGAPLAGGFVYTYVAGTTTPQNSYTDSTGGTPASNPVTLDSAGRAQIWLSGSYKIVVKDSLLNTISTADNVVASGNVGDMTKAVYDAANIGEQLVGLTATQTLSNKSATTQTFNTASTSLANMLAVQGSQTGGFINKFRNAAFDIWQRGTSGTITAGSPAYTADGWIVSSTGANVPWAQVAGRANTRYALKVTGAASVTDVLIKQRIESYLCNSLYPQATAQVTVQAKVYNNTGSSITPTITVKHAGAVDDFSSPVTDVSAVSLQACPNTTVTTVAYTFASASGTTNGLEVTIDFGNNFGTSGKSVEVAEWDIRVTPGVSTGLNSTPPVVELRAPANELVLCQRYLPAFNSPASNAMVPGAGTVNSSTVFYFVYIFPTLSRAVPSGITNSTASGFTVVQGAASVAATSLSLLSNTSNNAALIQVSVASGLTANSGAIMYATSSGQILLTGAEL